MRLMTLVPTTSMLADSLTKPMVSLQLLRFLTTGKVFFENAENHPVKSRVLPSVALDEESDLLMTDEEIVEKSEKTRNHVLLTTASILFGIFTGTASKKVAVASTLASMATPVAAQGQGNAAGADDQDGNWVIYVMVFMTVVLAIFVEKAVTKFFKMLQNKATGPAENEDNQRMPGKKRPADDAEILEEIEEMTKQQWTVETARAFYERTRALHLDYVNRTDMLLKEKTKEIDQAHHDLSVLTEKLQGQEDYANILLGHKEQAMEKGEQLSARLDELRTSLDNAESDKEETQQMYDEMAKLYNEAVSQGKHSEAQLRQCLRERDKARNDVKDLKMRLADIKKELTETEEARDDYKEKFKQVMHRAGQSPATPPELDLLEAVRENEKMIKEGLKMSASDLEAANQKLIRENENYVRAYRALQKDLHEAKAPEEKWIVIAADICRCKPRRCPSET
eukprot:s113_g28.t1